jgi:4-amino-4-deoxy-L-arabinose transferase-like glycosyltransferase
LISQLARDPKLSIASQPADQALPSLAQRVGWAILIALTLYVCYFSNLSVIGFVGPDEPRYAWIARAMAETGDWVTPRLYGRPWFEKPPLLYWGGAIFFKLLGEGHPEVAARLPSAISALLETLVLAWLAWRTYGEECARLLLLLLPTSVGMIGFSHACATDMPFAGMLTVAMVCAAVVLGLARSADDTPILPRTPWIALVLFGFFLGLAVLAKGPAGVILVGGAVFFWAVFTKRWHDALRLLHPAAIAAFCVTALPWYILCAHRNPDFFRVFIIEHNFKRFLTPEFQHIQPFWYYLPILLVAFLPWIALVAWAIYSESLERFRTKHIQPLSLLFASYSVFCLLFFSVSKSKLPGYILPSIPAAGLLLSGCVHTFGRVNQKSLRTYMAVGTLFFAIVSAICFELGRATAPHSHVNGRTGAAFGWLSLFFSLSNLLFVLFRWSKKSASSLHSLAAMPILIAVLCATSIVNSPFQSDPSGRTIARELRSLDIGPGDVFLGRMNRGQHYSLNFYWGREIPDWDQSRPRAGYLLLPGKSCSVLIQAPYVCSERPVYLQKSGEFLYQITAADSLGDARSGGKP